MKTQVAIIGAGPAGLLFGHLLRAGGIECVVVERAAPDYVFGRIRAGVLERTTTDLLHRLGLDARLNAEGMLEEGFALADGERLIRIDTLGLTGKHVTVYGQTEVTRDLMDGAPERGLEVIYKAADVALHDIEGDVPFVTYEKNGSTHRIDACFIAGCDGYYGPSRQAIPKSVALEFERVYPFGWLGIQADVPPCHHELITPIMSAGLHLHPCGRKRAAVYYIDVPVTEKIEDWADDRLWNELEVRLGPEAAYAAGCANVHPPAQAQTINCSLRLLVL